MLGLARAVPTGGLHEPRHARPVNPVTNVVARIQAIESRIQANMPSGRFDAVLAQATATAADDAAPAQAQGAVRSLASSQQAELTLAQMLGRPIPQGPIPTAGAEIVASPTASAPAATDTGYVRPVEGRLSSKFGPRVHPITGQLRPHRGVDFSAPTGTPISAAAGGTVTFSGEQGGYGNVVIIDHGDGTESRYAHQHTLDVAVGQTVRAGDQIGTVGSTGLSTGPHLHFEIRRDGEAVDPAPLLGI